MSQSTGAFRRWCDRRGIPLEQQDALWAVWRAAILWRDREEYRPRRQR